MTHSATIACSSVAASSVRQVTTIGTSLLATVRTISCHCELSDSQGEPAPKQSQQCDHDHVYDGKYNGQYDGKSVRALGPCTFIERRITAKRDNDRKLYSIVIESHQLPATSYKLPATYHPPAECRTSMLQLLHATMSSGGGTLPHSDGAFDRDEYSPA